MVGLGGNNPGLVRPDNIASRNKTRTRMTGMTIIFTALVDERVSLARSWTLKVQHPRPALGVTKRVPGRCSAWRVERHQSAMAVMKGAVDASSAVQISSPRC